MNNARIASLLGTMTLAVAALTGATHMSQSTAARDMMTRARTCDSQEDMMFFESAWGLGCEEETISGFAAEREDLVVEYDATADAQPPLIEVVTLDNGDQKVHADGDLVAHLVAPAQPITSEDVLVVGLMAA